MRCLILYALLLLPFLTRSQSKTHSIFDLDVFVSSAEKELFTKIETARKADYLQLFLASDDLAGKKVSKADCRQKIERFLAENAFEGKSTPSAKAIKKLYKTIHDAFFEKYTDNPGFSEMFLNGNYNCATASALYAYLLDTLQVEYHIRETPNHVYIIAAPSTHNVVFETTAPGARVLQFTDKMKSQYLEYLYKNKLISKAEWENGNKDELFEKYFYSDKPIDIRQLAGILYYNRGLDQMENEKYEEAYKDFEKSYFLYPAEKSKYFASACLGAFIGNLEKAQDQEKFPRYIVRYGQLGDKEVSKEMAGSYLETTSRKLLYEKPDAAKYLGIYHSLLAAVDDEELRLELRKDHYYNMAYYFYLQDSYRPAKVYLDSLYSINNENLLVRQRYPEIIYRIVQDIPDNKKAVDSLDYYFKQYPFIAANQQLIEYKVFLLAKESALASEKEDFTTAVKYMWMLDATLKEHSTFARKNEIYILPVYTAVSSYYVRKGDYKNAQTVLKAIEKHLPGNEEITRRLKHAEKMLNK